MEIYDRRHASVFTGKDPYKVDIGRTKNDRMHLEEEVIVDNADKALE